MPTNNKFNPNLSTIVVLELADGLRTYRINERSIRYSLEGRALVGGVEIEYFSETLSEWRECLNWENKRSVIEAVVGKLHARKKRKVRS